MNVFNLLRVSAAALLGLNSCFQEFKFIATALTYGPAFPGSSNLRGRKLKGNFLYPQESPGHSIKTVFTMKLR